MSAYAFAEGHYVDSIQGITTIKSASREDFFISLNKSIYEMFQGKIFSLGKVNLRFGTLSEIVSVLFISGTFGLTTWLVLNKELQLGEMVAILSIVGTIMPSIGRLAVANVQVQEASIAFERMFDFTSIEPEYNMNEGGGVKVSEVSFLDVKNIKFRFVGRKPLFTDLSLFVKKGEMVAILGESGGGKSSLIYILQRFYLPESGIVEVNGFNLNQIPVNHWRNLVGVVSQEVKIFNGNLLFNLTLSYDPGEYASAMEFCQKAGFDRYFQMFPQGYLTILGEEGVKISGGQKQLVSLARALYRQPKLLLLDEPTASMDRNMELFVMDLLLDSRSKMSIIVTTHRIQAAKEADRIYILEQGGIAAAGTPEELMQTQNLFSDACRELSKVP